MKLTLKTLGKLSKKHWEEAFPKNFYKQEKYNQRVYCHEF